MRHASYSNGWPANTPRNSRPSVQPLPLASLLTQPMHLSCSGLYLWGLLGVGQRLVHRHVAELVVAHVDLALVVHARHLLDVGGRGWDRWQGISVGNWAGACRGASHARTTCVLTECGLKVAKEAPRCCVLLEKARVRSACDPEDAERACRQAPRLDSSKPPRPVPTHPTSPRHPPSPRRP